MDVGYLETEILIVFEDQPAISKHVEIFTSIAENLPFRKVVNGKNSCHAMLSDVCIVLTSDCCHATLFHLARTFTTVCYFKPVKNPIKSHKTRTATNRIMLAQCLRTRIKIQICNLRNGVFLTSWLTAFCSEFIIAARNVYGE